MLAGLLYTKFSKPQKRAATVVFSHHAAIQRINGNLYFTFQVFDTRKRSTLSGVEVRCYAILHERKPNGDLRYFRHRPMRLVEPNDDTGSKLFLALPELIVHPIDAWSPLAPPRPASEDANPMHNYTFPEPRMRFVDTTQGNRNMCTCPVCGDSYETMAQLRLHLQASAVDDRMSGHDVMCTLETGETFVTPEAAAKYAEDQNKDIKDEEEKYDMPEPPTREQQLEHSHHNHLSAYSYYLKHVRACPPSLSFVDDSSPFRHPRTSLLTLTRFVVGL